MGDMNVFDVPATTFGHSIMVMHVSVELLNVNMNDSVDYLHVFLIKG